MEKDTHEKVQKLQLIEENLHNYLAQKQQAQAQLMEIESATEAMSTAKQGYKIIGNIMVEQPSDVLKKDLAERMERVKLRIGALEKQEKQLKEKAEKLQKEIMKEMEKGE